MGSRWCANPSKIQERTYRCVRWAAAACQVYQPLGESVESSWADPLALYPSAHLSGQEYYVDRRVLAACCVPACHAHRAQMMARKPQPTVGQVDNFGLEEKVYSMSR